MNKENWANATTATAESEDAQLIAFIELLFFAYRDFISDPDEILEQYGFGRAHHRVIHFVGRHPGIRVAELLDILRITKQSLGRVLKELIDTGYVYQKEGPTDRRRRLLYLTEAGCELHGQLMSPQLARARRALDKCGVEPGGVHGKVLFEMIDRDDHDHVLRLLAKAASRCKQSTDKGE